MPHGVTLRISGLSRDDVPRIRRALPNGATCVELTQPSTPPAETAQHRCREIVGRLIELDLLAHTARLQTPAGADPPHGRLIPLRFRPDQADALRAAVGQRISAVGLASIDAGGGTQALDLWRIGVQPEDQPSQPLLKPFRWPALEERLDNVDIEDFLLNVHGVDEHDA